MSYFHNKKKAIKPGQTNTNKDIKPGKRQKKQNKMGYSFLLSKNYKTITAQKNNKTIQRKKKGTQRNIT